jgi:thiol-disulfide isomerase/thioredoxin
MGLSNWFSKYKKKKKSSIISDVVLVALVVVMLVPSWRREVGALIVRVVMTAPSVDEFDPVQLSHNDLNLTYTGSSGQTFHLDNMLDKPVLLTYWATWCHHCVAELPALQELYNKTGDDIHLIVLVNEDLDETRAYINGKGYNLPIYRQTSRAPEKLYSNKIPASFLIDRSGKLLLKETGATKWGSDEFISYIQKL